jgi:hypothetical protein
LIGGRAANYDGGNAEFLPDSIYSVTRQHYAPETGPPFANNWQV